MSQRALATTILAIALPAMLTNVATALFGLADTFVIGRLGDPAAQGGVEVGAKLLMTLLIVFNFLRASTVALTAQASGLKDDDAQAEVLVRALAVALAVGVLLLAAAPLVVPLGLEIFSAAGAVAEKARLYVQIRYVGSLAWLVNAVLTGWLVGQRQVRTVLVVEVGANLVHILLDTGLVLGVHLGVAGVALATLTSETLKCAALSLATAGRPAARRAPGLLRRPSTWRAAELGRLLRLNRDLFGRTALLMGATILLTRAGARQGAVVLAANAILYQLFMLSALLLDGFESAAQVLCGESTASRDLGAFRSVVRASLIGAGATACVIAAAYALARPVLSAAFSVSPDVAGAVRGVIGWAVVMPLAGFASYVFDGIFIGAGWTRAMLATMGAALMGFIAALVLAQPYGDHGLWAAFSLFLVVRGVGQALMTPGLIRRTFSRPKGV